MKEERMAAESVSNIIKDIEDRSGLGNEWENIDNSVRREIISKWEEIIVQAILRGSL